ncbi:MAG TPA: PmoA family protein [Flavitalea sp.]|nr:PmoA family protein [Flavitalea sp.]
MILRSTCIFLFTLTFGVKVFSQAYDLPYKMVVGKNVSKNKKYFFVQNGSRTKMLAQKWNHDTLLVITAPEKKFNAASVHAVQNDKKIVARITFLKTREGLVARVDGKPVFEYHTTIANPPADSPLYYQRSGFIHPLYSPSGAILTDDFPDGHVHQHAIFTAWANTTFRNEKIDFWNQHLQTGTVAHGEVLEVTEGAIFGRLKVKLRHESKKFGTVLEEIWTITLYPFDDHFLFDLESEQKNITKDTLYLNQYIYGGLAFRGSKYWNPHSPAGKDSMHLITSEGYTRIVANHKKARYVSVFGTIKNSIQGVTVFDHPGNFRYPQSIRIHPDMPYWVYSPVVEGPFTINPGATYHAKYRYCVFQEAPQSSLIEQVERNWKLF